jgi:O-acetyl-ADP-ribose deacetylase (regulator of RNase III)
VLGLRHFRGIAIDLWLGDLTEFACDAMVNAANSELRGSGGVDGAIHRVGGPEVLQACQVIGHCAPGGAVVTTAGKLPAKCLIHTVGPVWSGGQAGEEKILWDCYQSSLLHVETLKLRHVACSAVSTGVYGYPASLAAGVTFRSIKDFISGTKDLQWLRRVTIVLFSKELYEIYQEALFSVFPDSEESAP